MAEIPGYGTVISYSTTQGGTYTDLAEVVDIKPPKVEIKEIPNTHYLSTNKTETSQAGLRKVGAMDVAIHFDKAILTTLYGTLLGNDTYWWKVTYNDLGSTASKLVFPGFLADIGPEVPLDGIATVQLSIKATGDVTWTAGT